MAQPSQPNLKPLIFFMVIVPIAASVILYQLDSFDAAPYPIHELTQQPNSAPYVNDRMLYGSELIGVGSLSGAEDLAYDPVSKVIYTGCVDGWIKRVTVNDSVSDTKVHDLVNTGGRPLGVALGPDNDVYIADAYVGLMKVREDGKIKVLADEAEGQKFKLTDGIDITEDGIIYFTDASNRHDLSETMVDFFEGKPSGRLISFDPKTEKIEVLVRDLYFANGVAVSPDQTFVVFCETFMKRCKKYYIKGEKKGSVEIFIDNLPVAPDNIRYDGEGQYWIGFCTEMTPQFLLAQKYTFIRKILAIINKYIGLLPQEKNSGVFAVDLDGKPVAHYYDSKLKNVTGCIKIGSNLYCGSLSYPHIIRLNLDKYPALSTAKH